MLLIFCDFFSIKTRILKIELKIEIKIELKIELKI